MSRRETKRWPGFLLVGRSPFFKLVWLADMDPGMAPRGRETKCRKSTAGCSSPQKGRGDDHDPGVTERCAGIDVGKRGLAVAVAVGPADKEAQIRTRWYGTTVPVLRELQAWLQELGCTSVAMQSTGSCWIPVKNILKED
jgi:hypothetical protein